MPLIWMAVLCFKRLGAVAAAMFRNRMRMRDKSGDQQETYKGRGPAPNYRAPGPPPLGSHVHQITCHAAQTSIEASAVASIVLNQSPLRITSVEAGTDASNARPLAQAVVTGPVDVLASSLLRSSNYILRIPCAAGLATSAYPSSMPAARPTLRHGWFQENASKARICSREV